MTVAAERMTAAACCAVAEAAAPGLLFAEVAARYTAALAAADIAAAVRACFPAD